MPIFISINFFIVGTVQITSPNNQKFDGYKNGW
jgi:hypothetical protein